MEKELEQEKEKQELLKEFVLKQINWELKDLFLEVKNNGNKKAS